MWNNEQKETSEVETRQIAVCTHSHWFSVCYLQSLLPPVCLCPQYLSFCNPPPPSSYPPLALLTPILSHPAGLSSLISHEGSIRNSGMLMFTVRSLLFCAHACLPAYLSVYLLTCHPCCLLPLLAACGRPYTSRIWWTLQDKGSDTRHCLRPANKKHPVSVWFLAVLQ